MNTLFYEPYISKRTPLILFLMSIGAGATCFIFGDIALPLCIATLAALFLFDSSKLKIFSILASVLVLAINALSIIFGLGFSFFGPSAVIIALVICISYFAKHNKSDGALLSTLICGCFLILGYALLAMLAKDTYTVEAVIEFYSHMAEMTKSMFVDIFSKVYNTYETIIEPEMLAEIIDMQFYMVLSYVFILAFLFVGVGYKFFSLIVRICSANREDIGLWRFEVSNLFAYSYVVLSFAIIFINSFDNFYFVAVYNLYNIFMVLFAYIGFKALVYLLNKKFNKAISILMIIGALVTFTSLASQLLALVGVIYTIRKNNEARLNVV